MHEEQKEAEPAVAEEEKEQVQVIMQSEPQVVVAALPQVENESSL